MRTAIFFGAIVIASAIGKAEYPGFLAVMVGAMMIMDVVDFFTDLGQ